MYIEGPLKSGKTSILIDRFTELIISGVKTSEIMVICQNSFKKGVFLETVKEKLFRANIKGTGNLPIYTFNGVVYNTVLENWPEVEKILPDNFGKPAIIPSLCGMETTEYLLKQSIAEVNKKQNLEETLLGYQSGMNLKHQLLRRLSLITENCLNKAEIFERTQILERSKHKAGMAFYNGAQNALDTLKSKTNYLRSFDFLKQITIFTYLLENKKISFDKVKYLLVDDIDELPYAAFSFIKNLLSFTDDFYLASDPEGGARRGYLCAYTDGWEELKAYKKSDFIELKSNKNIFSDAEKLFKAVKSDIPHKLEKIELIDSVKKAEMLDSLKDKLFELLKNPDIRPQDIIIVSPQMDEVLRCFLTGFISRHDIKYQFLSGSSKYIDDIFVFALVIIAQLVNEEWKLTPSTFEIRNLLTCLLGFPLNICEEILKKYKKSGKLSADIDFSNEIFDKKYQVLVKLVDELKEGHYSLDEQFIKIFDAVISSEINENSNLENLNKMFKSLTDFYEVMDKLEEQEKPKLPEKEWIIQIKNTVVSDNPPSAQKIEKDAILIATPQKVIDFELESRYQFWLDVSGNCWVVEDTGTLYNSWVYQKNWKEDSYPPELHHKLTMEKTAHLLRKLVLCAEEKIYAFSSQLDISGNENPAVLNQYLDLPSEDDFKEFVNITPREDQRPVLEYEGGRLAVSAVPGAGKTTIMQALLIELIKKNIKPEKILVITYMESAANLFLEKIKKNCPGLNELPHVSTIHGLAHRIIRDENNYLKLGLTSEFEICDDSVKPRIIREICLKNLPFGEEEDEWIELNTKAISKAKLGNLKWENIQEYLKDNSNQQLEEFLPVYKEYIITLRQRNLIDYDDMLVMATELLREYPEIRNYYQAKYKFVVEDEAQDSSRIQQELINLISGQHGNLIRCGDPNQAITTTFSSADVRGFREFIEKNNRVEMTSSQRCAKQIYELANHLIDWTKSEDYFKNAFLDLKMQPVEGKNADIEDSLNFRIFDNVSWEKEFVVKEIKRLIKANPDLTFGVLLRNNWQVADWSAHLEQNGVKYLCRTDNLSQKKVFKFLLKFLEFIDNPWNNRIVAELYDEFVNIKLYKRDSYAANFIKKELGSPFITCEPLELESDNLIKFWWDLYYWLENSNIAHEELIVKLGSHYFEGIIDKSNVYLVSLLVKKYKNSFRDENSVEEINLNGLIKHLKELAKRNRVSGFRFFDETDDTSKNNVFGGLAQVMTLHKSKGDEFDVVFIPEMYEYAYAITPDNVKVNESDNLTESINELIEGNVRKTPFEIQLEQIEETLRLVYVAITRARKYLYMSASSKKTNKRGQSYNVAVSKLLEYFISMPKIQTEILKDE